MIKRVFIDNYKCLVNFDLELDALSLLVGPNGVGKSAVLDVVLALRSLIGGTAKVDDAGIFPSSTLTRWQSVARQIVELDVELDEDSFTYRLEIAHGGGRPRARIHRERLTAGGKPLFTFDEGDVQLYRDDHSEGPKYSADWSESALARVAAFRHDNTRLTAFRNFVERIIVCGMYPRSFSAESSAEATMLSRTGDNFASWYRHVMQEHQDLLLDYTEAVRAVIDDFKSLRMEKVGIDARALMAVFENETRYELRLDELSDGQRGLLALYALVHLTARQGYTLFLDEPDNYIALAELQPWLFALSDACGDALSQAVLCSHHPELIDYLGPEAGIALARETTGVTTVKALRSLAPDDSVLKLSEIIARGWER